MRQATHDDPRVKDSAGPVRATVSGTALASSRLMLVPGVRTVVGWDTRYRLGVCRDCGDLGDEVAAVTFFEDTFTAFIATDRGLVFKVALLSSDTQGIVFGASTLVATDARAPFVQAGAFTAGDLLFHSSGLTGLVARDAATGAERGRMEGLLPGIQAAVAVPDRIYLFGAGSVMVVTVAASARLQAGDVIPLYSGAVTAARLLADKIHVITTGKKRVVLSLADPDAPTVESVSDYSPASGAPVAVLDDASVVLRDGPLPVAQPTDSAVTGIGIVYGAGGVGRMSVGLTSAFAPKHVGDCPDDLFITEGVPVYFAETWTGAVLYYEIVGLPTGCAFDTSTGILSGTPAVGTWPIDISAINEAGRATCSFVIDVASSAITDIVLAGVASNLGGGVIRVTPASFGAGDGAVWAANAIRLDKAFTIAFDFRISGGTATKADGMAAVIQKNVPTTSLVGGGGESLGAMLIPGGVVFAELDTYQNSPGTDAGRPVPHTVIATTDGASWGSYIARSGWSTRSEITDGSWHTAVLQWDGTSLTFKTDGVLRCTAAFAPAGFLGAVGYIGFTGAVGAFYNNHDVRNWTFTGTKAP